MSQWLLALAPLAGLAADVIVQILVAHLLGRVALSIAAGVIAGAVVTAVCVAAGAPLLGLDVVGRWAAALATYFAFSFGYWNFLNLNITSLRIRTLREILQAPQGISRRELAARYPADEFLRRRLERLLRGKQFAYEDGRWRLQSPALLALVGLLAALRALALPRRAWPDEGHLKT